MRDAGIDLLHEHDLVPEIAKAEQVLEYGPGCAAMVRNRGDHAADHDAQPVVAHFEKRIGTRTRSRLSVSTQSR